MNRIRMEAWLLVILIFLAGCNQDPLADGLQDGISLDGFPHPTGWEEGEAHGWAFLNDAGSCRTCHTQDIAGDPGSYLCVQCHGEWKTECRFCHGGKDNDTGAPPNGVSGGSSRDHHAVGAHSAHVTEGESHPGYSCVICHDADYASYEDPGHVDTRRDGADVRFTGVAGAGARYDRSRASCAGLYCHGNGVTASGQVNWTSTERSTCSSCHGYADHPERMTGGHAAHLREGYGCDICHAAVVGGNGGIRNKALHVNGTKDVRLADGGAYEPTTRTCTSECHENPIPWEGTPHPEGWEDASNHGHAFFDDPDSCRSCHGQDLNGGGEGGSCDACHGSGNGAWRTDCTYCHGGLDNATGAPPEGARGEIPFSAPQVGAHSAHVEASGTHAAYDCNLCHEKPQSMADPGHIDAGGRAEVRFSSRAGNVASYLAGTARCFLIYCHGNGVTPSGQVSWTSNASLSCRSCHAYTENPRALSGRHGTHAEERYGCETCHAHVVDRAGNILDRDLHVNGTKDVTFRGGGVYNSATKTCSSTECHRGSERWSGGD